MQGEGWFPPHFAAHNKRGQRRERRQGAAAGGALYALRGRAGNQCRQSIGRSAKPLTRRTTKAKLPFTRRTTSAVSAANECEGITCLWQVTRNDSDEAERSERSPSGVVSAANDEELTGIARQVRGASPAREWKCFASQREFRGERGGPEGNWPSGAIRIRRNAQFVTGNDTERRIKLKYNCMIMCDWKAEMNLRTPKTLRVGEINASIYKSICCPQWT